MAAGIDAMTYQDRAGVLHYVSAGQGDVVVLVHGYLGGSAQWAAEIEALSHRFRVIAVDLPGFANSSHLAVPDSIAGFARAVLDCLDDLGVQSFDLLGHSMGGMIVQEMVRLASDRVRRLILYATGAQGALPGRFETLARSRERLLQDGVKATARRISATWLKDQEASPDAVLLADLGCLASEQAASAALTAMETWDGRAFVPAIRQKTLILWGELDRTYTWAQTEFFWRHIGNASLAVVPNCSHAVHLDNPRLFRVLLEDFLSTAV